jgi:threonine dehydrogenase-like Zn-dependent dehydrogenase
VRGLVLADGRARVADDLPEPVAQPGSCRVRVLRAGVCATDLALAAGYMGFAGVPGHEFVGLALDGPLAGRRVVGEINAGCGSCPRCHAGDPRHCEGRTVLGILGHSGAFAEQLALPAVNLLPVPDGVSTDAATFAEPLAAALALTEAVDVVAGQPALVAGDGRLGLLCAHALHSAGAAVTVAGRHPERADLLPPGVAFAEGLLEDDEPSPPTAQAPRRFHLSVEATGNPDVLPRLLARMAPRGTVVLKTTTERPATLDLAPLVVDELRLVGSRCGRFAPALEVLAAGDVPVERFVDARFPLAQADQALARAAERGVLKVLIDVAQDAHP